MHATHHERPYLFNPLWGAETSPSRVPVALEAAAASARSAVEG